MSYYKVKNLYDRSEIKDNSITTNVTSIGDSVTTNTLSIKYTESSDIDPSKPKIFGPPLWFSLHNCAAHYPIKANQICMARMKGVILGIPVLLPCENCSDHATAHIDSVKDQLDYIVSGREPLFRFFVDFHNYVNKRHGKPEMSVEDAYKLYTSPAKVSIMSYELKKSC